MTNKEWRRRLRIIKAACNQEDIITRRGNHIEIRSNPRRGMAYFLRKHNYPNSTRPRACR